MISISFFSLDKEEPESEKENSNNADKLISDSLTR